MRASFGDQNFSVRVIAGTRVVLFGLNIAEQNTTDLLGFKIEKKTAAKVIELNDTRTFVNSDLSLVQEFLWADYVVLPGKKYRYEISSVHGSKTNPVIKYKVSVDINTEENEDGEHAVYFNRGVAGSQAYVKEFGDYQRWFRSDAMEEDPRKIRFTQFLKPQDVSENQAFNWLSRGLEEALLAFISQAKDSSFSIRASLYELSHIPVAQAFVDAIDRGVDVKIVHHAKRKTAYKLKRNTNAVTQITYKDGTKSQKFGSQELIRYQTGDAVFQTAMRTIGAVGIRQKAYLKTFSDMMISRTQMAISHNKFIILLKDTNPIQVWTGSTNITAGGIFGQSNVGHIIRNEEIAKQYYAYWEKLSEDPKRKSGKSDKADTGIKNWLERHNPNLNGPVRPNSCHVIFSPRIDTGALQWYADQIASAKQSVFFTAAFSMDEKLLNVLKKNIQTNFPGFRRYLLLEGITGLMRDKYPLLKKSNQNSICWGDNLKNRPGINDPDTFIETLSGLNDHVNYVHNKFLLIDALTDDPLVVTGSANFSEASTINNDENMLVVRGNTRLADIYMGEFMRLYTHFKRRNEYNALSDQDFTAGKYLDERGKWLKPYFQSDTQKYAERILFSTNSKT